jgi:hypothetical protein
VHKKSSPAVNAPAAKDGGKFNNLKDKAVSPGLGGNSPPVAN